MFLFSLRERFLSSCDRSSHFQRQSQAEPRVWKIRTATHEREEVRFPKAGGYGSSPLKERSFMLTHFLSPPPLSKVFV